MKILIADDEKNIRDSIAKYLSVESFETVTANNGLAAQRLLQEDVFHAMILDLRMPGMDGLELLKWIKENGLLIPVIMISAYQDVKDAVEAMKLGAKDYIVKPFDPEELILRLKRIINEQNIFNKVEAGIITKSAYIDFIGESKKSLEIKNLISKVAKTPSNVLITGNSGTGKEVAARLIHELSGLKDKPFVPVNVGGIPENLLESELFGYEKGAFTGADARKIGIFEVAKDGTLFLDEIGEMPMHLQVKLLRVLQDRKIQRLGSVQPIPINARIISATNKNLEEAIKNNLFREDLYFRLNIIRIELPPLKERKEDIPALTGYFINKFNKVMDKNIKSISSNAIDKLLNYDFPGNIRELENIIERAFIFAEGNIIEAAEIDIKENRKNVVKTGKLKDLEREAIVETLRSCNGNRTHAAEELGFTRRTLINKIKEYDIKD
jgi:two-component system, NtrC family, response regulator AtoC